MGGICFYILFNKAIHVEFIKCVFVDIMGSCIWVQHGNTFVMRVSLRVSVLLLHGNHTSQHSAQLTYHFAFGKELMWHYLSNKWTSMVPILPRDALCYHRFEVQCRTTGGSIITCVLFFIVRPILNTSRCRKRGIVSLLCHLHSGAKRIFFFYR